MSLLPKFIFAYINIMKSCVLNQLNQKNLELIVLGERYKIMISQTVF